ncbi:MAG: phosphoribosylformylglycinamidine cyclo-ligase [Christensenellales bacterium]|jgi:phosphoribosylformylglycinamidine cyclo-ligase
MPITYKDSGVDVESGYEAVRLMKEHVKKTFNDQVLGDLGSFGGFYSLQGVTPDQPVLVAGTDGVGTKLKIAFAMDKHDTIGIDAVAMCVNDVVCQGARPLLFLDYIASGKLEPEKIAQIVKGVSEGCVQAGAALIGGETAEMPGMYTDGEYDLAGFSVGIVGRDEIVTGADIGEGDALVGLASSGIHSNGYSLVRRLLGEDYAHLSVYSDELGMTLGEAALTPTRIYVKSLLSLMAQGFVKGAAHITGGGFIENIPRMLPEGLMAKIDLNAWEVPPIFRLMQRLGEIPERSIFNTFNMGIGMVLAVAADKADALVAAANALGERACILGQVAKGEGVALCR